MRSFDDDIRVSKLLAQLQRAKIMNKQSLLYILETDYDMKKNNVRLVLGDRAKNISANDITLASGERIKSDCTILSSGIKINDELHAGQLSFDIDTPVYCSREADNIYCA